MLPLRGRNAGGIRCAAALLFALGGGCLSLLAYSADCSGPIARIVSLQGSVEILRQDEGAWTQVKRLETLLCAGDQLRTGLLSRAAVYIHPETVVRLDHNSTLRFVEQTDEQTLLEFRQEDFTHVRAKAAAGQCGVGYFVTRFPRKLKVRTRFYNAAIEGTEFQVAMSCDHGELAVFEGKVAAESVQEPGVRVVLQSGQSTSVGAGEQPAVIKSIVRPADAVQWALYYLPISDAKQLTEAALTQDCDAVSADRRSTCIIRKAEYLLGVGRVPEARARLSAIAVAEPGNGDVLALQSIIALVQNEQAQAMTLARRAIEAAPNSPRSFAALSYVQQAHFKLEEALATAERAAQLASTSALAKAREAELRLSLGRTRAAERDAREAVRLNSGESRGHLILGFVHLAQSDSGAAQQDFTRAVELDSTEPFARLGLGLAMIREGRLKEGREQIEIAVALDPANSLVRSYVGKVYYEENTPARDRLAATQFGSAKALDPNDPTPWFYDAILKQTQNRPVEALHDLQESIARNDNRAVYRSKLGLDEERATRASGIGRIFLETGYEELARISAFESLAFDPANSPAHRLLADSYATEPRLEIARQSELLQAQLRQPPAIEQSLIQIAPELNGMFLPLRSAGESQNADRAALFVRPQERFEINAIGGSQDTIGAQIVGAATRERMSGAISLLSFDTDGFRENDDDRRREANLVVNTQPDAGTNLHIGGFTLDRDTGDLTSRITGDFDPFRRTYVRDSGWVGLRHQFAPEWDVIVSGTYERRVDRVFTEDPSLIALFGTGELAKTKTESLFSQAQTVYKTSWVSAILGLGYFAGKSSAIGLGSSNPHHANEYVYANAWLSRGLLVTAGLSRDDLDSQDAPDRRATNPKLGIAWTPWSGTTLRLAAFSVLKRRINADQALEPTQIVGFNQFVDDINGAKTRNLAAAVDQSFGPDARIGGELRRRLVHFPAVTIGLGEVEQRETLAKVYAAVLPTRSIALRAEVRREAYEQDDDLALGSATPTNLRSWFVPFTLRYFGDSGFTAFASTEYVHQKAAMIDAVSGRFNATTSFWVTNVGISQQLPGRRGKLWLQVRNLFDKRFRYQDLAYLGNDPTPRLYAPSLEVMVGAALSLP